MSFDINAIADPRTDDFAESVLTGAPGDETLDRVVSLLRDYVVFPSPHHAIAVTLFVAHTYALDAADASPYLHITSPEKRSGKSRLLDMLELLVARPWRVVSPSEAVIFRKIESTRPTLMLDEVDTIFGKDARQYEGLRALLNAGNRRGTCVPRCVGEGKKITLKEFSVFGAKAIAGIGELPDTVADRSIRIELARRAPGEHVIRFRHRDAAVRAAPTRDDLEAWVRANVPLLRDHQPAIPTELDDRAADAWEPLLAIADAGGGMWPSLARQAALTLAGARPDEGSLGLRLLADIRDVFAARATDRLPTEDLLRALIEIETAPWPAWWGHRIEQGDVRGPASKLARLLKPYRVEPRKMRAGAAVTRGYQLADFTDLFDRYLAGVPTSVPTPETEQRNVAGQRTDPPRAPSVPAPAPTRDVPLFRPHDGTEGDTERARAVIASAFGPIEEVQ